MNKKEIIDKIAEITADVCNVTVTDIFNGNRREDVVLARTVFVFWCNEAGISVEGLLRYLKLSNPNSINAIKARIEEYWTGRFVFHMLLRESGHRLREFASSIGEQFDVEKPLRRMSRITGKY